MNIHVFGMHSRMRNFPDIFEQIDSCWLIVIRSIEVKLGFNEWWLHGIDEVVNQKKQWRKLQD